MIYRLMVLDEGYRGVRTIKNMLILCLFCVSFLVITFFSSHLFVQKLNSVIVGEVDTYFSYTASRSTAAIAAKINGYMDVLKTAAIMVQNVPDLSVDDWISYFAEKDVFRNFQRTGFIFLDGIGYGQDVSGVNFFDRDYFKTAMSGEACISDVLMDRTTRVPSITFAVPLMRDGTVFGVFAAVIHTGVFQEVLSSDVFKGSGFSFIADSRGMPVTVDAGSSHIDMFHDVFDSFTAPEKDIHAFKSALISGKSGVFEYSDKDSAEFFRLAYTPVGIKDWFLISVVPVAAIAARSAAITGMVGRLCVLTSLLFSMILVYVIVMQMKSKSRLKRLVFVDKLTGGRSAAKFMIDAEKLLSEEKTSYALAVLDIDKFELINDLFGYAQGDTLLKHMAQIIGSHMGKKEIFARINADRFCLLVEYRGENQLDQLLSNIMDNICGFRFDRNTCYTITVGSGAYIISNKHMSIHNMIDRARMALRKVKGAQGKSFYIYNDEIRQKILEEKEIENDMQTALSEKQFCVYLQPKYDFITDRFAGAEALVRWIHPVKGLIPPDAFIPVFEKNGFVTKLDMYMLDQVCVLMRKWLDASIQPVPVSVNQSRLHLFDEDYLSSLTSILNKHHISPELIELELTESVFFQNESILSGMCEKLHKVGFRLSMDDFGSGYSSLGMLKDVPVDVLKIDKLFFHKFADSDRGKKIVSTIIAMAKGLQIQTVAEGVETSDQAEFLHGCGCDFGQGYFYAKPLPAEQYERLLYPERYS